MWGAYRRGFADHKWANDRPVSVGMLCNGGRLIPITVLGSPSTPLMNQPPSLSTVNPPATCNGSPLSR